MAGQRIGYVRGLASITFLNNCNTSIQLSVDPQFRGRVLALYLAVLQGGTAPGAPLVGWIGTEFGARWAVAVGGAVVLLTALFSVIAISRKSQLTMRNDAGATQDRVPPRKPALRGRLGRGLSGDFAVRRRR